MNQFKKNQLIFITNNSLFLMIIYFCQLFESFFILIRLYGVFLMQNTHQLEVCKQTLTTTTAMHWRGNSTGMLESMYHNLIFGCGRDSTVPQSSFLARGKLRREYLITVRLSVAGGPRTHRLGYCTSVDHIRLLHRPRWLH